MIFFIIILLYDLCRYMILRFILHSHTHDLKFEGNFSKRLTLLVKTRVTSKKRYAYHVFSIYIVEDSL